MASGIPVMSADCPTGPREILAPDDAHTTFGIVKNGAILPMIRDETDLEHIRIWADTVQQLIRNPELLGEMKMNALERVKSYEKSSLGPLWTKEYLG
jgi:glycosyltransferase involved in cell wall biosynthesis